MNRVELWANAKINLALDVLGKREDGYHEVQMIMQSIAVADHLVLTRKPEGIVLEVEGADLAAGPANLAYRAAELLCQAYPDKGGVQILLQKTIPLAAGLAGGSADAAAVLVGLNRLWQLGLTEEELCGYGERLGSDVPFCIAGGTQLAEGRGERLTQLADLPACWVVLVKVPGDVATAEVYGKFRLERVQDHPDVSGMRRALDEQDLPGVLSRLGNVLETVTVADHPVLAEIKATLAEQGAAALMSGSGPSVFGIVGDAATAEAVAVVMRQRYPGSQVFVAKAGDKVRGNR